MSITQRWLPGGDKFEQQKADEERDFMDRVRDDQVEILLDLRTEVSTWTENQIENGKTPELLDFVNEKENGRWDHVEFHNIIEAEMNRVTELCMREAR